MKKIGNIKDMVEFAVYDMELILNKMIEMDENVHSYSYKEICGLRDLFKEVLDYV